MIGAIVGPVSRVSMMSTRAKKSSVNRSLLRGIEILRAFRPGSELLGNGDLAERTGLSRATVSRLAQTLVEAGFLEHDRAQRAYRLGAPVLSLGHAMRTGSSVLRIAAPMMTALAKRLRINVGLAVRDRDDMVYLESIRMNARGAQRSIVSGHRVPIELTSLGRAYLAVIAEPERAALLIRIKRQRVRQWPVLAREIADAAAHIMRKGYCHASWQPDVVALAAPVVIDGWPVYVLNVSVTTPARAATVVRALEKPLLELAEQFRQALTDASEFDRGD